MAGHRADYVEGARYRFFDGRGERTDFGSVTTAGQVVVRTDRSDGVEVILESADPAEVALADLAPGAQELITLDINGKELGRRPLLPQDRTLSLTSDNGAVSTLLVDYRLTDPAPITRSVLRPPDAPISTKHSPETGDGRPRIALAIPDRQPTIESEGGVCTM